MLFWASYMHVFCISVFALVQHNWACFTWKGAVETRSLLLLILLILSTPPPSRQNNQIPSTLQTNEDMMQGYYKLLVLWCLGSNLLHFLLLCCLFGLGIERSLQVILKSGKPECMIPYHLHVFRRVCVCMEGRGTGGGGGGVGGLGVWKESKWMIVHVSRWECI